MYFVNYIFIIFKIITNCFFLDYYKLNFKISNQALSFKNYVIKYLNSLRLILEFDGSFKLIQFYTFSV